MSDRADRFVPPDDRLTQAYREEVARIKATYPADGSWWQRFQRSRKLRLLRRRMMDRSHTHG